MTPSPPIRPWLSTSTVFSPVLRFRLRDRRTEDVTATTGVLQEDLEEVEEVDEEDEEAGMVTVMVMVEMDRRIPERDISPSSRRRRLRLSATSCTLAALLLLLPLDVTTRTARRRLLPSADVATRTGTAKRVTRPNLPTRRLPTRPTAKARIAATACLVVTVTARVDMDVRPLAVLALSPLRTESSPTSAAAYNAGFPHPFHPFYTSAGPLSFPHFRP